VQASRRIAELECEVRDLKQHNQKLLRGIAWVRGGKVEGCGVGGEGGVGGECGSDQSCEGEAGAQGGRWGEQDRIIEEMNAREMAAKRRIFELEGALAALRLVL
jgi:hypothetical protein